MLGWLLKFMENFYTNRFIQTNDWNSIQSINLNLLKHNRTLIDVFDISWNENGWEFLSKNFTIKFRTNLKYVIILKNIFNFISRLFQIVFELIYN